MSNAYLKVICGDKEIRKFGCNKSEVKALKNHYKNITLEEFLNEHQYLTKEDYDSMRVVYRNNNWK